MSGKSTVTLSDDVREQLKQTMPEGDADAEFDTTLRLEFKVWRHREDGSKYLDEVELIDVHPDDPPRMDGDEFVWT